MGSAVDVAYIFGFVFDPVGKTRSSFKYTCTEKSKSIPPYKYTCTETQTRYRISFVRRTIVNIIKPTLKKVFSIAKSIHVFDRFAYQIARSGFRGFRTIQTRFFCWADFLNFSLTERVLIVRQSSFSKFLGWRLFPKMYTWVHDDICLLFTIQIIMRVPYWLYVGYVVA
jgi:hypothetical protein